jgi:hypothetical protein
LTALLVDGKQLAAVFRIKALWRLRCCALPVLCWGGAGAPGLSFLPRSSGLKRRKLTREPYSAALQLLDFLERSRERHAVGLGFRHACAISARALCAGHGFLADWPATHAMLPVSFLQRYATK